MVTDVLVGAPPIPPAVVAEASGYKTSPAAYPEPDSVIVTAIATWLSIVIDAVAPFQGADEGDTELENNLMLW